MTDSTSAPLAAIAAALALPADSTPETVLAAVQHTLAQLRTPERGDTTACPGCAGRATLRIVPAQTQRWGCDDDALEFSAETRYYACDDPACDEQFLDYACMTFDESQLKQALAVDRQRLLAERRALLALATRDGGDGALAAMREQLAAPRTPVTVPSRRPFAVTPLLAPQPDDATPPSDCIPADPPHA